MPTETQFDVMEQSPPETHDAPEIEVIGDEAVVRVDRPEGVEERRVRLPKTTWG